MLEAFNTELWCGVVWALLHSIWQACIIALLLGLALRKISAKRAALRYWLSVSALVALVLTSFFTLHVRQEIQNLSAVTAVQHKQAETHASPIVPIAPSAVGSTPVLDNQVLESGAVARNWTAIAAFVWVIGVLVMVLRTIGSVFRANRFSDVNRVESGEHLENLIAQSHKMGLSNPPSFWSSDSSGTPYVVGFLAPAVVVPLSMLTSLTASELQTILAHELAHIKRHDYLANLFQMVIEAAYFFNPAVWWISHQIRLEREACCDQIAIQSSSNKLTYATILANWMHEMVGVSESKFESAPTPALAFGGNQPGGMLERIQRILKPDSKPNLRVSPLNWLLVLGVSVLIAGLLNAGSKAVTHAAVQVLSDSERVAKIEDRQGELKHPSGVFEKGKTTIRGRISTEDGGEVEAGWIHSQSQNGNASSHKREGRFEADQEFKVSVSSGVVYLAFFSKSYAPAIIGPFEAEKDQTITRDVKLVKGNPHVVHVVDEEGQPVVGAKVHMNPEGHNGPIWNVQANEQGEYVVKHRRSGQNSRLSVHKNGYLALFKIVKNDGMTKVTLKKALVNKGIVLSAKGEPVANAKVRIMAIVEGSHSDLRNRRAATTDSQGRFESTEFSPTGIHELLVTSDEGIAYVGDVVAGDDLQIKLRPACSVDMTIRGDVSKLSLRKDGKLVGAVKQHDGDYYWRGVLEDGSLKIIEQSEDQVRLKLTRLWPGSFTVRLGKFQYHGEAKPGNHSVEADFDVQSNPGPPVVASLDKAELRVQFRCNGKLVKPGGGLYGVGPSYNSYAALEDGELRVSVEKKRVYLQPAGLVGFTFESKGVDIKKGKVNEIAIDVEPAGAVSGRVVDWRQNPVSASVSCSGLHNHFTSDRDGKFLLTPIPLGAKVRVKAGDRFNPAISDEVLIDAENPMVDLVLKTAKPTTAKVRVVDLEGNPIPGVELTVRLYEPSAGSWGGSLATNAKGEKEIAPLHPTWSYTVTAAKRGFASGAAEDLVQGGTTTLKLQPGCVVRGRLLDKDGNPVSQSRVYAELPSGKSLPHHQTWINAERETDREGRFEFTRLPKGEIEIQSNNVSGNASVVVDVGVDNQPIELRLEKPLGQR